MGGIQLSEEQQDFVNKALEGHNQRHVELP